MSVSTSPSELVSLSACYNCIPEAQQGPVLIYILASIASLTGQTPAQLMASAKCYQCMSQKDQSSVMTYLLNQIVNGGSSPATCAALSGAGDPTGVTTPEFSGQLYHDTANDVYYRSTGTTSADWTLISGGVPCANLEGAGDPT